jgi:hypothetical protein
MRPVISTERTAEKVRGEMTTHLGGVICARCSTIDTMKTRRSGSILSTGGGSSLEL